MFFIKIILTVFMAVIFLSFLWWATKAYRDEEYKEMRKYIGLALIFLIIYYGRWTA